ncbi:MAG: helix-turn-helix domain-containing protein [Planctomycetes bacterium]|nr:helix-turn-helix domain-containing protein [Planctomycetota bacterium]
MPDTKKETEFQIRIKALKAKGMKGKVLAARAGVDESAISKLKSGLHKFPTYNVGRRIVKECEALGLTDEVLGIEVD